MYWGPQDASVSFCEKDYEHTEYIAEIMNTYSSFIYVLFGIALYQTPIKKLAIGLICVGFGSVILHGTMRYYGQMVDELSMLVLTFFSLNMLNKKFNNWYLIPLIISYFFLHQYFIFFASLFVILMFCIVNECYCKMNSENCFYAYMFIGLFSVAKVCWLLDQFFCEYVIDYNLHAWWHVLTCIAIFYGFIFLTKILHNKSA